MAIFFLNDAIGEGLFRDPTQSPINQKYSLCDSTLNDLLANRGWMGWNKKKSLPPSTAELLKEKNYYIQIFICNNSSGERNLFLSALTAIIY